jgi:Uma2 family endonuclease
MSTQSTIPTAPSPATRPVSSSGVIPYRVSVRQFRKMISAGVFGEHDHVELLDGILVDKMTKHPPHNFTVAEIADVFRAVIGPDWVIQEEKSVILGRFSLPEPDVAVAKGPRERYRSVSPKATDLGLLIEVADTSYAKDRGNKAL